MSLGKVPGPYKLFSKPLKGLGGIQDFLNSQYAEGWEYVGKTNDGTTDWWIFKKRVT